MRLREGMIKLPQALLQELQDFTLTWYFAHVQAVIDRRYRFDEEGADAAQSVIDAAQRKYGVSVTPSHVRTAREKRTFMRTFRVNDELYGAKLDFSVKLKVLFEKQQLMRSFAGLYRDNTAFITLSPYNMHMTGPSLSSLSALRYSLAKIDDLLGYLEHELTHLVQHRALAPKHDKQVQHAYTPAQARSFDTKYVLDPTEFDPTIKSEAASLKRLMLKYKGYPGYSKQGLIDAFVFAGPAGVMTASDQSNFFHVLKQHDPARWKKAVKLLMTALST